MEVLEDDNETDQTRKENDEIHTFKENIEKTVPFWNCRWALHALIGYSVALPPCCDEWIAFYLISFFLQVQLRFYKKKSVMFFYVKEPHNCFYNYPLNQYILPRTEVAIATL
jgi:hypothetical protein